MELVTIAYARNGFHEKFGIPRQSREDSLLLTRIVFAPEFRVREALRGIEDYSHLWLLWGFSQNKGAAPSSSQCKEGRERTPFSPTVRPPRLGGNTRMGVFATRSPYRPNPIGLTSVRLLRVEETPDEGLVLVVSGADLLDGTPIYDVKPYLSFSDSHPDAKNGFAEAPKDYRLEVVGLKEALSALNCSTSGASSKLSPLNCSTLGASSKLTSPAGELYEILSQDPRPAYQDDPERVYGLTYANYEVHFRVEGSRLIVEDVCKC